MIRTLLIAMSFVVFATPMFARAPAFAGEENVATIYKNPQCGCCEGYAEYLRQNGFSVAVIATDNLDLIKQQHNVPEHLEGCHTTLIDGYVVEGHVPVSAMDMLLSARLAIVGISLPGMPMGSPGMGGDKEAPFTIYEISNGAPIVYTVE